MGHLCFYIEGENLTQMARNLALEGDYDRAMSILTDGLDGMTTDYAVEILLGRKKLVGCSPRNPQDENTLGLGDDMGDPDYLNDLLYPFLNCFRVGRQWYEPYAWVTGGSEEDWMWARKTYGTDKMAKHKRYLYYADDPAQDICVISDIGVDRMVNVLCRKRDNPPFWLWPALMPVVKSHRMHSRAVDIREPHGLSKRGPYLDLSQRAEKEAPVIIPISDEIRIKEMEKEEANRIAEYQQIAEYHQQIVEQAAGEVFEVIVHREPDDNRPSRFVIPKIPFVRYFLKHDWYHLAPAWSNVCPYDFKMLEDNRDHSDWMIGSDPIVPFESWYGNSWEKKEDRPLKNALAEKEREFFAEYTGTYKDVFVLSGSGETDYHPVFQPTDENSVVENGDVLTNDLDRHPQKPYILVVPSAHPSYSYLAMNAAAVVTEVGGALCHLAVITREKNIPVVRVKDACKKYTTGTQMIKVSCIDSSIQGLW